MAVFINTLTFSLIEFRFLFSAESGKESTFGFGLKNITNRTNFMWNLEMQNNFGEKKFSIYWETSKNEVLMNFKLKFIYRNRYFQKQILLNHSKNLIIFKQNVSF